MRVGLTGGIGSGKSTVAAALAKRGALVIDADSYSRAALAPGAPAVAKVIAAFGPQVLHPTGEINRAVLAEVVFANPARRHDLERIVLPVVDEAISIALANLPPERIAVVDHPLLIELGRTGEFDVVVVVIASEAQRLSRLRARGISPDSARARMAAQVSDDERRAVADFVLVNDGSLADLDQSVDQLWDWLQRL